MRQTCKACLHERRAEIDQAIREGIPYRSIAEGFGLGLATIWRHKRHLEQGGTQAEQIRNKTEQSYTEHRFTPAEQQTEQSGTKRNKAEQPAGQDNTGQEVFRGVIDTLRSELQGQRETLNRLLQDHAKERERADTIIMQLRGDVKLLNDKIMLLTEGKKEQAEPPEETGQKKPKEDILTPEKKEEYRFTVGDRFYFMKQDIKKLLHKKIF